MAFASIHAKINKFIGLTNFEDATYFVSIFIAGVAVTAGGAVGISGYLTRNNQGAIKKIIRLNLIIFSLVILPTFSWILFRSELAIWYVVYAGLGLWPVLLLAFLIPNFVAVISMGDKSERTEVPRNH